MATLLTDECLVLGEPAGCWKDRGRRNHGGRAGPRGPARLGTGARASGWRLHGRTALPGRTTTGIGDADAAGARRRAVFLAGPRVCSSSAVPLTFGGGWYVRCGRSTVASDSFFLFSSFFLVLLYYIATPLRCFILYIYFIAVVCMVPIHARLCSCVPVLSDLAHRWQDAFVGMCLLLIDWRCLFALLVWTRHCSYMSRCSLAVAATECICHLAPLQPNNTDLIHLPLGGRCCYLQRRRV